MKKIAGWIMAAAAALVMVVCVTAKPAEAATVYRLVYTNNWNSAADRTVGGAEFSSGYREGLTRDYYVKKDGVNRNLSVMYGAEDGIVTNGSTIYYTKRNSNQSVSFYKTTVKNTTPVKIRTITTTKDYLDISLATYYSGFVYFIRDIDPGTLYRLSVKTGKYYKVATNVTTAEKKGRYLYLMPYNGDVSPHRVRIYDMVNKTLVTLNSNVLYHKVTSSYIYYAQVTSSLTGEDGYVVDIKRANLDGTGKKTLTRALKVGWVTNITSTKVTYVRYRSGAYRTYTKTY